MIMLCAIISGQGGDSVRKSRVTVLVDQAERKQLIQNAKAVGMTVSAYIRWKALHCKDKEE